MQLYVFQIPVVDALDARHGHVFEIARFDAGAVAGNFELLRI
jgi:hypothetical protein